MHNHRFQISQWRKLNLYFLNGGGTPVSLMLVPRQVCVFFRSQDCGRLECLNLMKQLSSDLI